MSNKNTKKDETTQGVPDDLVNRLRALHGQIADSMDHLINEECTYAEVLTAPDRIQNSLCELRRLDEDRFRDDLDWVQQYFPHLAAEVEKETE